LLTSGSVNVDDIYAPRTLNMPQLIDNFSSIRGAHVMKFIVKGANRGAMIIG